MKRLSIEIADTPSRRSNGLMNRKKLGENEGMLFKFPTAQRLSFWMKSTYIPLDIAFLDSDGTILQIEKMYPLSYRTTSSHKSCKLALEVNQGWFSKNNVGVGDRIKGLEISDRSYRCAQVYDESNFTEDAYQQGMDDAYDDQSKLAQDMDDEGDFDENPKVELTRSDKAKIEYAERNNLPLQIVYLSKASGQTLPPRKLVPVPNEGYPIRSGEGGEYFVGFDVSPTIMGGDWEIAGNQIKRFLFANIIALEVIEEFVN
ncbi:MAG: DUF192 domain-containing protein [Synergistaceae bacterium]